MCADCSCRMSLPAYTQPPCVPCTKNELDLESVSPLQIGIIDDYLVHTGPKSGLESGGPLQFLIPTSSDDNLDLSHSYLYLKCWVLNSDGSRNETLKSDGLGDEYCPGGHEWKHLPLQGLPDDAAQLWMWCQGDLVKAPVRLADGWRWKIWCSGKHRRPPHW